MKKMAIAVTFLSLNVLAGEKVDLTTDKDIIDPESYNLAVSQQALIWSKDSFPRFIVWPTQAFDAQFQKSYASLQSAEEAVRIDEKNAFAHALLARYFLVPSDTYELASEHWRRLFEQGLGVSFPSLFYDVDNKRYFLSQFRRDGIYIYRFGRFGVEGMKELPDESNTLYWEAQAGYIPPDFEPDAVIYWKNVKEIKTGNWVHWLKLDKKVTIESDRGKKKTLNKIKVSFLGGVGKFDWHFDWYDLAHGKFNIRTHSYGPADYNARLRSILLELVDPEGRIKAPKAPRPGPGW